MVRVVVKSEKVWSSVGMAGLPQNSIAWDSTQLSRVLSDVQRMSELVIGRFYSHILNATRIVERFRLPPVTQNINSLLIISDQISQLLQTQQARYLAQIQSITSSFDAAMRQAATVMATVSAVQRLLDQSGMFAELSKLIQEEHGAADAFSCASWPITPSMSRAFKRKIAEMHHQGRTRYVSQVIIAHYKGRSYHNLQSATESWRSHPQFVDRMHILDDALWAHRQGKFTLSVPATMAQIEGVMSELVVANGLSAKLGKIQKVYEAVTGDLMDQDFSAWAIATTLNHIFGVSTYASTTFEKELKRLAHRRRVNRHTVLHGIMSAYDREIHSLRAFLLLDALSALRSPESSATRAA